MAALLAEARSALVENDLDIANFEAELKTLEQALRATQNALEDTQAKLEEAEKELKRLEEGEKQLGERPSAWRLLNPVGFYVDPYDAIAERQTLTAITCVGLLHGFEPLVYYRIADPQVVDELIGGDAYQLVGEAKWSSADWTSEESDIEKFYTRNVVLETHPYKWSASDVWVTNELRWFGTLHDYCSDTITP